MTFVDSNIPMYLVGGPHPCRDASRRVLEDLVRGGERLVTDAEVLQEILHRYVAIDRRDAVQPAFEALLGLVDEVFSIDLPTVQRARDVVLGSPTLSARDAIHVAVIERNEIGQILSFDPGFDQVAGLRRLPREAV